MIHSLSQHPKNIATQVCLLILVFVLSSCAQNPQANTPAPVTIVPTEIESTSTLTPTETLTATPTLLSADATTTSGFGLVLFAMGDGRYTHLFVYDPYSLPFTRLTADKWDDEDPAISPDGKQIALSSNRDGQWDIYIMDITLDQVKRVTNTKTYDGQPEWSPDGQNIVYQTMNGSNLDLILLPIEDENASPIQITENAGDNFGASWSPDGQQIAFTTNRNGKNEIWLFNLKSAEDRFSIIASSDQADYIDAAWSPDGTSLAWCRKGTDDQIETISIADRAATPKVIGIGCSPSWSPDGNSILAVYQQPNAQYLIAYNVKKTTLSLPMIQTESQVKSVEWINAPSAKYVANYANLLALPTPVPPFTSSVAEIDPSTGRFNVVELKNVSAPYTLLSDTSDESFNALRSAFGKKVGWDFLAELDDAYLPLTATSYPNLVQNWLYTGRAIALNSNALAANWMMVTREDYSGETYWRVWVKCLDQSGACGSPILSHTWDFSSRSSGDLQAYEEGGSLAAIPDGYWIDFTEFARRYGWERLPAQNNWRSYYQGTLYNYFVFREGLTWRQAMLQINSPEAVTLFETGK
jgi:TolB protein